ncbi:MAG: hypothetical protein J0G32_07110 [Alphaproteobacteria bacterium]|nr:hypothetical protein [Alphaproteobacteria bacterium]OJV14239.1 MAG: hypothetical protein BGO27_01920 [Alphaproteobacteria bacterium 33-17]
MNKTFQIEFPMLSQVLISFHDNSLYLPKSQNEKYQLDIEYQKFCQDFNKDIVENMSNLYFPDENTAKDWLSFMVKKLTEKA